ncbi:MAG: hypothetical protein F8N37_19545 [Telmatospirillum sp.]|nr:hypothetical protein [Telmatospirillum sp.]
MPHYDPLTPQEIANLFGATPPPPDGVFELALVLGGTVSAGSYTAGALDFLFEALDEWEKAKATGDASVPRHQVVIRFMVGTSGGGVTSAIAARALAYAYPPVSKASPDPHPPQNTGSSSGYATGNPLYDIWVNELHLAGFLETGDLNGATVPSLLNGGVIDAAAARIVEFAPVDQALSTARPWVASPLRVIMTVTNRRGVPYRFDFGSSSEIFVNHADHLRHAVVYPNAASAAFRPDESTLSFEGARTPGAIGWDQFAEHAKAPAAFPAGFPQRQIVRPREDYRYRVVAMPAATVTAAAAIAAGGSIPVCGGIAALTPDWDRMISGDGPDDGYYRFSAADGGATDNEPIELGRTALAGYDGCNDRDPMSARRAVLLIDPFGGDAPLGDAAPRGLLPDLLGLPNVLVQQARYDTRDVRMALDPNVGSRFMLSASRGETKGQKALATAGLGAFLGFACRDFRRHDYLLGRQNCQDFLRGTLLFPDGARAFGPPGAEGDPRPLIPLFGSCAVDEALDPWPQGRLDPAAYRDGIEDRFKALVAGLSQDTVLSGLPAWLLEHLGEGWVADKVVAEIDNALTEWGLKA